MATPVLVFGVALLAAVLTSALASRSPLSTTTVFLGVGMVAGPLGLGLVEVDLESVEGLAELALFAILFADGQHSPWSSLRSRAGSPARALVIGMPLTAVLVTLGAHWITGLAWGPALVLGAVLAPTDPVFASALVGREDVPDRVRRTLNVESGLNDGLALPAVLVLAGMAGGDPLGWSTEPWVLVGEALLGIAIGIVIPVLVAQLLRIPGVGSVPSLQPLGPLAVALLVFGVSDLLAANQFLAAFVAGATVATVRPAASESFRNTGELVSEMTKGAALLAFASLLDRQVFVEAGILGFVLAVVVIAVCRPVPLLLALAGTSTPTKERWAVAWFGPKGFASLAYAVIVAGSGMPGASSVLALTTVAVLVSVVAHSSTDVLVAERLRSPERAPDPSPLGPGSP